MQGDAIRASLEQLRAETADLDRLLTSAVELVHASNPKFNWTGIYELFDDGVLRLGPFIGAPTDHPFIADGHGLCGTAMAQERNLVVPDVSQIRTHAPCVGAVRSELVVLIRRDGRIYAQIDIDSQVLDAFEKSDVETVENVAEFLADCYAERDEP